MKPTQSRKPRGWNLATRIVLALVLGVGGMLVVSSNTAAHAVGPPGRWGSALYNNSSVGIGVVTDLGNSWSYIVRPWNWSSWNVRGAYTGPGYCTNVYYDFAGGNGWEYQWQIRGARYYDFAYWWAPYIRTDTWRC